MRKKELYIVCLTIVAFFCSSCIYEGNSVVKFTLYGTDMQVRFDPSRRVEVKNGNKEEINKCLEWIRSCKETLEDCQRIKKELNLSDWAYVKMLDHFAVASLDSTNEAVLLMYSLLTQSGYGALINAVGNGQLRISYQSDAFVYDKVIFNYNDHNFFLYGDSINIDDAFVRIAQEGKPIDFRYQGEMKLAQNLSKPRTIKSLRDTTFTFTIQVNKNLVDYYGEIPSVSYDDNFMNKWTTIANYPLEQHLKNTLIKEMKETLKGKTQLDKVNQILYWVQGRTDFNKKNPNQDCFLFAFDVDVWGEDRTFYSEESLYYPYYDSEDRAIFFSRIVRDVVGLDVVLVYYPGHLATAVCFTEGDVKGDYLMFDNRKFIICDPTYIGSFVGEEMPSMIGIEKTVILLEK